MLKNYFKVVEDFSSSHVDSDGVKLLSVEKGEIIVDVKDCGDDWVIGKEIVSQKTGKIPRKCIEMLNDNDNDDGIVGGDMPEASKRCSRDSSHEKRLSSEEDGKATPNVPQSEGKLKAKAPPPPQAPPRHRKSREVTKENGSFRSRGSDEGYNSSSHYSGDKPSTSEPIVNPIDGYCNANLSDTPLLSSFKESPNKLTSPRPSITDAEGYEIPIFTPRSSIVNGEVATGEEKGVTLKFIFNRKSTALDEKAPPIEPREKILLNSIGENSESIYETWSADPKSSSPSSPKKGERREKIFVGMFIAASLLLSLGFFFLLLFVARLTPLLCFTISVNIFAIFFIVFLTMENKRWLCILSLLAPSLFSKKVKTGICITLCILIIAAPICNFSSNLNVVFRCKSLASTANAGNATKNAETLNRRAAYSDVVAVVTPLPNKTRNLNQTSEVDVRIIQLGAQVKNASFLRRCTADFGGIGKRCTLQNADLYQSCVKALNTVITRSLDSNCSSDDTSCVSLFMGPHIQEVCRNFSLIKNWPKKPRELINRAVVGEKESFDTFRDTLLELLPLLLLLVLHEAYRYNRDYLSNKELDNVYITGKLKALDGERKARGMRNKLFPLRKLEFRKYVLPSFFLQTSRETKAVFTWLIIWLVLGLSVLLIVLLDKYIYNAFVFLYEDTKTYSSCDMKFKEMDPNIIYMLCFILALLLIAVLIQSYILRARSRICSFFYPQKESARGVYLYHKILQDRSHFWKDCRERGCTLSEARRTRWQIGIGHRVFRTLPAAVRDAMEKLFVYRCMICDSLTCRKTFVCKDQECFATFCYECYIDMGQTCISCRPNGMRDSVFTSV